MKKLVQAAVVAALLTTGAAHAADQYVTRYTLDGDGDLVAQQYLVEDKSADVWKTVAIVALIVVGVGGLAYLIDRGSSSSSSSPEPTQPTNPLLATGGTQQSSWSTDFVQPIYTPVQ